MTRPHPLLALFDAARLPHARALTRQLGGLRALLATSADELSAGGLVPAEIERLRCARTLFTRLLRPRRAAALVDPRRVAAALPRLARATSEEVWVIAVDALLAPIARSLVARGSASACACRPGDALSTPLRVGATRFFILHNHPSGDPTPSPDDHRFTERLDAAARIVGLELLDHLVVAGPRWSSCKTGASGRTVGRALGPKPSARARGTGQRRQRDAARRARYGGRPAAV